MTATMTWVGLDVHARSTHAAAIDVRAASCACALRRRREEVVAWLRALPQPVRGCYEAGPTGFALYRAAEAAGLRVEVIAPSKTPRAPGDRIKTDRKDAELLVRLLLGGLADGGCGAAGGVRGGARSRACPRAGARRSDASAATGSRSCCCATAASTTAGTWTKAHRQLARRRSASSTSPTELAYLDALAAIDGLRRPPGGARRAALAGSPPSRSYWPTVARLRCFRGIDTL